MTNRDDPRLTAYALGELEPAEARDIETALENDPAAREAVEKIRRTAQQIATELQSEPAAELSPQQRQAVQQPHRGGKVLRFVRAGLAAAAVILIGGGALWAYTHMQNVIAEKDQEIAMLRGQGEPSHSRLRSETGQLSLQATNTELKADQQAAARGTGKGKRGDLKPEKFQDAHDTPPATDPKTPPARPEPVAPVVVMDKAAEAAPARTLGMPEPKNARDGLHPGGKPGDRSHAESSLGIGGASVNGIPPSSAGSPAPVTAGSGALATVAKELRAGLALEKGDVREYDGSKGGKDGREGRKILERYKRPAAEDDEKSQDLDSVRGRSEKWNREAYAHVTENDFQAVEHQPLSTFSIDVDTASYANVRRMLKGGQLPPPGAVRIEELLNYFSYSYAPPKADDGEKAAPFAAHMAVAKCPWTPRHRLVRVAVKGKVIEKDKRPATNLVFLLDVSGSMRPANKLPLVKQAMKLLVEQLDQRDRVAIAVYAGASGLVLESTGGHEKATILGALDRLGAGGSTNGGAGIKLAYSIAQANFIKEGVNRVILCTDGDFNVGTTNQSALIKLIQEKAKSGVFLTVLGFGRGNLQDNRMESLADKGNGAYGYIDNIGEARKHFVDELTGTLVTIAKDVKIQVEFNPARVAAYRLIGYENRMLAAKDFNDDKKDAGEIGAGHTVTALYEIVPAGGKVPDDTDVDALKYQTPARLTDKAKSGELLTLKMRYKAPDGDTSTKLTFPLNDGDSDLAKMDEDFRFATAVAAFGMILRDSKYKGAWTLAAVEEVARGAIGKDAGNYRAEFVSLVEAAGALQTKK